MVGGGGVTGRDGKRRKAAKFLEITYPYGLINFNIASLESNMAYPLTLILTFLEFYPKKIIQKKEKKLKTITFSLYL